MFFLLIYLLFQCQFLFVEVNGNEEDITIFFLKTMRCVQDITRETDSMGSDSMILERLFYEPDWYKWTISSFLSISQQLEGSNSWEWSGASEAMYACFCPIINSYENSRSAEVRQRAMFIPWNELAKNSCVLWNQQEDIVQAQTATWNWTTDLYRNVWWGLDWHC